MKKPSLVVCISLVVWTTSARPLRTAVAETTLCELTAVAEFVVLAKTQAVIEVDGVRVARASVEQGIKGELAGDIFFLAQGTWTCDIADAEVGETDLLFLKRYEYQSTSQRQEDPDEEPTIGTFKEPLHFKAKITRATGTSRLFQVAWAGRGQMPVRVVDNTTYVTIWTDDVQLPTSVETIDGPDAEYADFIRSAPLDHIMFLVRRYLTTCGRSK
jgi:hypothetical protein